MFSGQDMLEPSGSDAGIEYSSEYSVDGMANEYVVPFRQMLNI